MAILSGDVFLGGAGYRQHEMLWLQVPRFCSGAISWRQVWQRKTL